VTGLPGKAGLQRCIGRRPAAILPPGFRDPESLYYVARQLAYLGDSAGALGLLTRAVEEGFSCFSTLTRDP